MVMSVLRVEDRGGDSQESVQGYRHQVEDGGGAANNIHRQIEITQEVGKIPLSPVCL